MNGKTSRFNPLACAIEAIFNFQQSKKQLFLTVVEKRQIANFIANKLSEIMLEKAGGVVEARI